MPTQEKIINVAYERGFVESAKLKGNVTWIFYDLKIGDNDQH